MDRADLSRLDVLKTGSARVVAYRDAVRARATQLETAASTARYRSDVYQKCSEIFKKWLEDSLERNVGSMAELVTSGLRHVIPDQEITFKIKQDMRNNRVSMRFVLEQDGVEGDPLSSFGGGAANVISLVLRLSVMSRMGMGNLLILDEAMDAVWSGYVPNAAAFMRELSERTGVNILMVTHNSEFVHGAHVAYEGDKDKSFRLRRLKGSR